MTDRLADLAEAIFTTHDDGTVSMAWGPENAAYTLASRELLRAVVERINGAPTRVTRLERALREAVEALGPVCECGGPGCREAEAARRVAREALEEGR